MPTLTPEQISEYYKTQSGKANPLSPLEYLSSITKEPTSPVGVVSSAQGADEVAKIQQKEQKLTPPPPETKPVEKPAPQPEKPQAKGYSFDEAYQLWGSDFSGLQRQPDGTFVPNTSALSRLGVTGVSQVDTTELDKARTEYESAKSKLMNFNVSNDPAFKQIMNNITAQWDARISDMEETNRSRQASLGQLNIRLGGRYAEAISGGIMSAEERAGIKRISDLEAQKQSNLIQAKQAYESQKWEQYAKLVDLAEKDYNEQLDEVNKLNEKAAEEAKKAAEQKVQASRDSAIAGLISQGVTDPFEIIGLLNYDEKGDPTGGDFTFEEVYALTSKNDLNKAEKDTIFNLGTTAKKYGAPDGVVQGIFNAKTREEAVVLAGDYLTDPNAKIEKEQILLENQIKRLEIEKRSKEINAMGEKTTAEIKAEAKAIQDAEARLPILEQKIDLIDGILNSKALGVTVGPTKQAREGIFVGIPGVIGFGKGMQRKVAEATGEVQNFIGSVEQLVNKEFLDGIIALKSQGGTLGALSEREGAKIEAAATKIGTWKVEKDGEVVGYNISEDAFMKELNQIKTSTQAILNETKKNLFTDDEKQVLDLYQLDVNEEFNFSY